mmetsp:Transcript_30011/g.56722  ORF Transcript_30011/g.56722 Transcript_30011/m.56722 type:complete len:173 (-) Transcript_30011:284-802(-)
MLFNLLYTIKSLFYPSAIPQAPVSNPTKKASFVCTLVLDRICAHLCPFNLAHEPVQTSPPPPPHLVLRVQLPGGPAFFTPPLIHLRPTNTTSPPTPDRCLHPRIASPDTHRLRPGRPCLFLERMKKMGLHKNAEKGGNAYLTLVPIHCLRPHSLPSYASANAFVLLIRLLPT